MDGRRDWVSYVQDERYAAGAWMRRSGVYQFCTLFWIQHGRQGGAVSYFRTCRYVQDERYFAIEHRDVRRKAYLRIRSRLTLRCANLKEAAPAHPCNRVVLGSLIFR